MICKFKKMQWLGWCHINIWIYQYTFEGEAVGEIASMFFWSSLESDMFCFISEKNSWLVWCLQYAVKCPGVGFHPVVFFFHFPKKSQKMGSMCWVKWRNCLCVCVCSLCFSSMDVYRLNSQTLISLIFLHLPRVSQPPESLELRLLCVTSLLTSHSNFACTA